MQFTTFSLPFNVLNERSGPDSRISGIEGIAHPESNAKTKIEATRILFLLEKFYSNIYMRTEHRRG
jgi:hypothetical protein